MSQELLTLLLAVVLAGTANMIFVRSTVLGGLRQPVDGGRRLPDGRRLFGANKTWKGLLGMPLFTALATGLLERLGGLPGMGSGEALRLGAALGTAYVLAELPNSFLKRRLGIGPGARARRPGLRIVQLLADQADSVLGCVGLLALWSPRPVPELIALAMLGIAVHFAMNRVLYALRLKSAWT